MYLWALLSGDISEPPAVRGITDDLDRAMRVTEPYLIDERACLCRIVEVRYAMCVPSMDMCYVPTGRGWSGRRDNRQGVSWQETEIPAATTARDAPDGHTPGWDACDFGSSQNPSKVPATPPSAGWRPPPKPSASTRSSAPTT
jgi:hypothetical protein